MEAGGGKCRRELLSEMVAVVLKDFPPRHFVAPRIRHRGRYCGRSEVCPFDDRYYREP